MPHFEKVIPFYGISCQLQETEFKSLEMFGARENWQVKVGKFFFLKHCGFGMKILESKTNFFFFF